MPGMDLDHWHTNGSGCLDLGQIGIDKQRDPDTGISQLGAKLTQPLLVPYNIKPTFSGQLLTPLRDETAIGRPNAAGDGGHLRGDGHLQVHPRLQKIAQHLDIAILDMAPVFAQMQGDRVRPCLFSEQSGLNRFGIAGPARLAQGGDMIDIDPE